MSTHCLSRNDQGLTVAPRWLGWYFIGGILEDYGLNPDDHPDLMIELNQGVGEAIIDTILETLNERAADPLIATALAAARGEDAPAEAGQ